LQRLKIAIKAAMVAGLQQQEITMAQIGTFTRAEDGSYTGTIKTLSLNIKARLLPAELSENEKAPNLRVMAGNVEIGAAWQRTSKDNTVYHSVKLDDPSFPAPIYANLVAVDEGYALVWSRRRFAALCSCERRAWSRSQAIPANGQLEPARVV
jgi:uncharacterized protein (DUF736 family)